MKLLNEFLPIILFFSVFKYKGLMAATLVAIFFSVLQLIITKLNSNKYNPMQLISCISLLFLGGIAVIFKKEIFIKLKPTAIYWLLAIVFLVAHLYKGKTLIEHFSNNNLQLPRKVWNILNILWVVFFFFMGGLNLYVVYSFDTTTWVNFKLFGSIALTLIFILGQIIFIYKYFIKI